MAAVAWAGLLLAACGLLTPSGVAPVTDLPNADLVVSSPADGHGRPAKSVGWIAGPNGANNKTLASASGFLLHNHADIADRLIPCCQGLYVGYNGHLQRGMDVSCASDFSAPGCTCISNRSSCAGSGCACEWAKGQGSMISVPPPCGVPPCSTPGATGYGNLSVFIAAPSMTEVTPTFGVKGVKGAISSMYIPSPSCTGQSPDRNGSNL